MLATKSQAFVTSAGVLGCFYAVLGGATPADAAFTYTENFTNQTFAGWNFAPLELDPATIAGPGAILRRVSVNATLNASVNGTWADDLTFYLDIPPLSTGGRLQIGGFSNLNASTRLFWPNGLSSTPGTTVIGSFDETYWIAGGAIDLYTYYPLGIWGGNGYNGATASGTWTGSLTIEYEPVYAAASVPSPLPIAGAAAAFGWARRLRRRINTTTSG